ncbi:MAG: aminodeoxychorismate/anthranilate synthase component II [Geminicoccaceae bacterium]|nr:aminodeoxychorismate/anthranilate synthase component II [Geminicoccaceae bacterium]
MILLVDNYDSFVFNLARYVAELGFERLVVRNDAIGLAEIETLAPTHILLSPGPCGPAEAGISVELVRRLGARIPILGVCLGHQCIAAAYGGRVGRARRPMHGRTSPIVHRGTGVFRGLPSPLRVTRYHSLIVEDEGLPDELEVTARSPEGEIMGLAHRRHPVHGVQFHPEAVLTEHGHDLLRNFLSSSTAPSVATPIEGTEGWGYGEEGRG